jgi:glycosyltransferase involved in cell wall biosynthesis
LEQHNLEWQIFWRLLPEVRPPLRQLVRLEALSLRSYERKALRRVDSVIAISKLDATEFKRLAQIEPIAVPPFVVSKPPHVETTAEFHVGYIGHLAWQPNVFGLNWFCREVWPIIAARLPNAKLTIAGPGLSRDAQGALRIPTEWRRPGIQTVGFVDNLNTFYRSILVAVAPVVGGSGVRMKLLETMSSGIPTVTTTDGAAGLNVANGEHVMIADEPSGFADAVVQLLSEVRLRERIRQGGYAYLDSEHSAEVTVTRLKQALGLH